LALKGGQIPGEGSIAFGVKTKLESLLLAYHTNNPQKWIRNEKVKVP
jgi:hypothetical protein